MASVSTILTYNHAGNMTTIPCGDSGGSGPGWESLSVDDWSNLSVDDLAGLSVNDSPDPPAYLATYDAWNRLIRLQTNDGEVLVSEFAYDGAKRRIVQRSYSQPSTLITQHLYYTQPSQWQMVEERLDDLPDNADRQFVWGLRYIDDLIVRDRFLPAEDPEDPPIQERFYAIQDANWNVTAIVDSSGAVQERYAYSAYGVPVFLSSAFVPQAPAFNWETLYCGYRFEAATGLFHVRHRTYHPTLGCWVIRDLIGYAGGINLRAYASARPVNSVDPSGLKEGEETKITIHLRWVFNLERFNFNNASPLITESERQQSYDETYVRERDQAIEMYRTGVAGLRENLKYCCETLKILSACTVKVDADFKRKPLEQTPEHEYPAAWGGDDATSLRRSGILVVLVPGFTPPIRDSRQLGTIAVVEGHTSRSGLSIWSESGNVLSHELGHWFEVNHKGPPTNLMHPSTSPGAKPDCEWCEAVSKQKKQ